MNRKKMTNNLKKICYLMALMICAVFIFACGKEQTGTMIGILDDELEFREPVIEEGIVYKEDITYDYDGQDAFITGDAALDAEKIGKLIRNGLEGQDTEAYRDWFDDKISYREFQQQDWGQLEAGWKANPYYDCYYTYAAQEEGYAGYTYYIYPDFSDMNTKAAKAVVFGCVVNAKSRKICNTKLEIYDISLTEYRSIREWKGDRVAFIKDGEIVEGGGWIEIPGQESEEDKKYIYTYEDMGTGQLVDFLREDLRTGNLENGQISGFFIEKKDAGLAGLADEVGACISDGWTLRDEYDFYYMCRNERAGTVHYRYYFYWSNPTVENEKALVIDTWITENAIQEIQSRWFLTGRHQARATAGADKKSKGMDAVSDIEAFLVVDWTDSGILMSDHAILPQDSAHGWEFTIADIDFDGIQEMLITFTANHCGTNSLYIYKQNKGKVFSYEDTIATPEQYIFYGRDYKKISPYMDIELMDAYVNSKGEYRYLSLDCGSFGGDIHGGIYTVILYETEMGMDGEPMELARLEFSGPQQQEEIFFRGEKIYEAGRLRDRIAEYMDGYTPVEIIYKKVEKSFARDVVARSDVEREKENQELQEAILKLRY